MLTRSVAVFLLMIPGALLGRGQNLAIIDATVYPSPDASAERHTTVLILNGKIAAMGGHVRVPAEVPSLPCPNCVVFAGFWNCHVHFTGDQWTGASQLPAATVTRQLQEMLTHSGFTTVVDTASDLENTVALRRRIESAEVPGPRIYTAGFALYPPNGIPYYLDDLPQALRARLLQPSTPSAAVQEVEHNIASGTDILKLFTGSYRSPDEIVHLPIETAKAAVAVAHKHGQLAFAHPSDLEGLRIARESGVDVLAHAPSKVEGIDETLLASLVSRRMAMIPTLKLFSGSKDIVRIREIVARFHALGGVLMFGTDTGFLKDYSVNEEYRQLALARLSFREVLSMLTTSPADRFGVSPQRGRLRPGADGDLTILSSDPAEGKMEDFANVQYTIRAGRVIFQAEPH